MKCNFTLKYFMYKLFIKLTPRNLRSLVKGEKRRILFPAAFMLSMSILLTGCSPKSKFIFSTGCGSSDVFMIDDVRCPKSEALMYLENYRTLYGRLGESNLFNGDFDDSVISKNVKSDVLDHLTRVYALDIYARDNDITLSNVEEDRIKAAAETYYSSLSKEDKSFAGVNSVNDIVSIYTNLRLADKVYEKIMKSIDSDVSEDEARVVDCYLLYVTDKSVANDLKSQLNAGAAFDSLLASYSEKDKGLVSFSRGEQSKKVEDAAFELDNGQISDVVSADDGYYIIECVNKYNEELSDANKKKILKKRKEKVLSDLLKEQHKDYYSEINDKLWDDVSIEDAKDTDTDSLFSTLDAAF